MSNDAPVLPLPDDGESGPYALVGTARARPGCADVLEQRLVSMVAPTREEAGSLAYHVHRDRADRSLFVFYEAWRSIDHLKRHFEEPHVSAFLKDRFQYLDGDLKIVRRKAWGLESPLSHQAFRSGVQPPTCRASRPGG